MTYVKKQLTLIKCNVCISSLIIKGKANAQKETKKKWEKQNTHTHKSAIAYKHMKLGASGVKLCFHSILFFKLIRAVFFGVSNSIR